MMAENGTLLSARKLAGDKVLNLAGEQLGKIEDFMLDLESGRIVYAVLSFGGVLGIGDKLFAVPPEALMLDERNACFVLDMDKATLRDAPAFERNRWPDFADPTFGARVYSYYGRKPYWT